MAIGAENYDTLAGLLVMNIVQAVYVKHYINSRQFLQNYDLDI